MGRWFSSLNNALFVSLLSLLLLACFFSLLSSPAGAGFDGIGKYRQDMEALADELSARSDDPASALVVLGSGASPLEKLLLRYARENYEELRSVRIVTEKEFDAGAARVKNLTVYVIGGPHQNAFSALLQSRGKKKEEKSISFGKVVSYSFNGTEYVVISDIYGYGNLPKNMRKSPLSRVVPEQFVPAAATAITLLLIWIGKLLFHAGEKAGRIFLSKKIMEKVKKKEIKKSFKGFLLKGVRIKYREWIAIFLSAAVFALATSYIYHGIAVSFILARIGVNSAIYALRHGARLWMDKVHGLHTEYIFWYWGAFLTVLSGWLGNTFSLAGYIASETKKGLKEEGHIGFVTNMATFAAFLFFAAWNLLRPSVFVQMVMTLSISISFLFMLPFRPFAGKNVYLWSRKAWWLGFVPITISYFVVNILLV